MSKARKPTQVQINEGDPGKYGVHKLEQKLESEPKVEKGLPPCPEHLNARARKAWEFLAEQLELSNMAYKPDAAMLEGACVNYARAVEADLMLEATGLMISIPIFSKKGEHVGDKDMANPLVAISNAAWKNVKAFCGEFGLSPAARRGLKVENPDNGADELSKILGAKRTRRTPEAVQ